MLSDLLKKINRATVPNVYIWAFEATKQINLLNDKVARIERMIPPTKP